MKVAFFIVVWQEAVLLLSLSTTSLIQLIYHMEEWLLSIKRMTFYGDRLYVIYCGATTLRPINDLASIQIRVETGGSSQSLVGLRLPAITINNMI